MPRGQLEQAFERVRVRVDVRVAVAELVEARGHRFQGEIRRIGIRHFVVAVTKMDLVDFDQAAFDAITADYRLFADQIGVKDWIAIPVSGLDYAAIMVGAAKA